MTRIVFILLTGLLFCGCADDHVNPEDHIEFNSKEWLKGDWRVRGKMVNHIIEDSVLYGKSKEQVLTLLGDPTASDTLNPLVYVVDIGLETGPFGLGGTWLFYLTVGFDTSTSKVVDVNYGD